LLLFAADSVSSSIEAFDFVIFISDFLSAD